MRQGRFSNHHPLRRASFISPITGQRSKRNFTLRDASHRVHDEDEDGKPFVRSGIFPFLSLPTEIRDHVYSYAFQQDGLSRVSKFHRGTIHTALLSTCKQVYEEASQLPLTSNRLCFNSCVSILDFVGFYLTPKTRTLCINVEIEMFPMAIHGEYFFQHTTRRPGLHKT